MTPPEGSTRRIGLQVGSAFLVAVLVFVAIAPPGYAESFDRTRGTNASGTYIAPFTGLHGWFWENRDEANATVRLETAGYYDRAVEYRGGAQFERADFSR